MPAFLHLDVDEVERFVVQDDLNHRSLALHLRQQVAEAEHREPTVATYSDRLAAGIGELSAESVGSRIGHRSP